MFLSYPTDMPIVMEVTLWLLILLDIIYGYLVLFIDGYSNAGNALAGKYVGEKNNEKLKKLGITLLKINIKLL